MNAGEAMDAIAALFRDHNDETYVGHIDKLYAISKLACDIENIVQDTNRPTWKEDI